jgi:superfamily II DNA helicase RecQ
VNLPTGGGKSRIMQIAALLLRRVTLTVVPLRSLQADQAVKMFGKANMVVIDLDSLKEDAIATQKTVRELENIRDMDPSKIPPVLLFASPKLLSNENYPWRSLMIKLSKAGFLSMVVVDELHMFVQQAGFRDELSSFFKTFLPQLLDDECDHRPQLLCMTATFPDILRSEFKKLWKGPFTRIIHAEPKKMSNRTIKLELTVRPCFVSTIKPFLASFMETDPKVKMIIYSNTRASLENIQEACKRAAKDALGPEGIKKVITRVLHGRQEPEEKSALMNLFCNETTE